ncbi:MAG: type III restriction endonuclease subunit R [Thermoplasmata archaeon]|nr:type III restriction endonuclease subunit R [Thermoplasmata archaeon]
MVALIEKLIVNSAFKEPEHHWLFSLEEDRFVLKEGRRPAGYFIAEQGSNQYNDVGRFVELPAVNEIRKRVANWRNNGYPGCTGVTRKLLAHWHDEEQRTHPFFFCQLDAIETLIWLTEAPDSEKVGINIDQDNNEFTRLCSKMATGTGKTVVMSMLIAWQVINKVVYPQDKRFSKYVLIITPGITVKNRLSVLKPEDSENYYDQFGIIPVTLRDRFNQGMIKVTNWHTLAWDDEAVIKKKHSVDKRGPLSDEAYAKKVLGQMSRYSNILVINDEAHHAWKKNPEIKVKYDKDDKEFIKELEESSTVWVGGLEKINRACHIQTCYDFSATPFAPSGKKNDEAALFSWIVSDFGLNDAIESGLVKTPRMVVRDDGIPDAKTYRSKLYHIYGDETVRADLSRPAEPQESLPTLVNDAYRLLAKDWLETYNDWRTAGMSTPPVMITVANRTETASRINYSFQKGLLGVEELCESDYILQIDSKILKKSESVDYGEEDFSGKDYDDLSEGDRAAYLRQKVNTVGRIGELGEQVRNIISVSMLSEGWDTKTVTHIMGLRAFSSQLLCEQTIGRGLRRTSYDVDDETGLFTPEYVNVFGVPFSFLPQEAAPGTTKPTKPKTQIYVRDDMAKFEIQWPNIIRIDHHLKDVLTLDLENIPVLDINASELISAADLAPFIGDKEYSNELAEITLEDVSDDQFRLQTTVFHAASTLYDMDWSTKGTKIALLGQLIRVVEEFLNSEKINIMPPSYGDKSNPKRRIILSRNIGRVITHIREHIMSENVESTEVVLDQNRPMLSTADMPTWYTSKNCAMAVKSHISHCVVDSALEASHANKLIKNRSVEAWVKNDHIGFEIQYMFNGGFANYRPDFIIRLSNGHYLVLETKGQDSERVRAKRKALKEWVDAVNSLGKYGVWHEDMCFQEDDLNAIVAKYVQYERDGSSVFYDEDPDVKLSDVLGTSVTGRVHAYPQTEEGLINPAMMERTKFDDGKRLGPENIHPSTVGLAVDYLTRFMLGDDPKDAFRIPLMGADIAGKFDEVLNLLYNVTDLSNESIINMCRAVPFDVYYRAGVAPSFDPFSLDVDQSTIDNIRIMVERTLKFFDDNGPITVFGPTFPGSYTDKVLTGDGDLVTTDAIWDLKVSKNQPTKENTLQLMIYYLMCKHSVDRKLKKITYMGIFNPRLNIAYTLNPAILDKGIIEKVEKEVIGYE